MSALHQIYIIFPFWNSSMLNIQSIQIFRDFTSNQLRYINSITPQFKTSTRRGCLFVVIYIIVYTPWNLKRSSSSCHVSWQCLHFNLFFSSLLNLLLNKFCFPHSTNAWFWFSLVFITIIWCPSPNSSSTWIIIAYILSTFGKSSKSKIWLLALSYILFNPYKNLISFCCSSLLATFFLVWQLQSNGGKSM